MKTHLLLAKKYSFIIGLLLVLSGTNVFGQFLVSSDLNLFSPGSPNPNNIGMVSYGVQPPSFIGRGLGVTGIDSQTQYVASGWDTLNRDPDAYYEFKIEPADNFRLNFINFVYVSEVSSGGPTAFELRSSIDNYTAPIGTVTATGTTVDLTASTFQGIENTVISFRLYAWGASSAAATFGIDQYTFNGTVSLIDFISQQSGNWNDPVTWTGSVDLGVPGPDDNVIISTATTVTIDNPVTRDAGTTTTVTGALSLLSTYTNNGTTNINGDLRMFANAVANTGNNFVYGSSGRLDFRSIFTVTNSDKYWPADDVTRPKRVTINTNANVTLDSGVNRIVPSTFAVLGNIFFPSATLTLNGLVEIYGNGTVNHPPIYGEGSNLNYIIGIKNRTAEWTANTSGTIGVTPGYPNNVTVSNGATLNMPNGPNAIFSANGNVLIIANGALNQNAAGGSAALNVRGEARVDGTLTLGSLNGGDITVGGNWRLGEFGVFNPNGRAVIFNGTTLQTIRRSSGGNANFDYLVIDKTSTDVQIHSSTDVIINGAAPSSRPLEIKNVGTLDLNGKTVTFNNDGGEIHVNNVGTQLKSTNPANLIINGNKTVGGPGTLNIQSTITTQLNKGLDFGTDKTTVNGTLQINAGGFVQNSKAPIYANGSTLRFNTNSVFNLNNGSETGGWYRNVPSTGVAQTGVPWNLTVAGNTALQYNSSNNDNLPRYINGNLTIDSGSSFTLGGISGTAGDFYLRGDFTNLGTFNPNQRAVFFNGTANQNITGPTTFDFLGLSQATGNTVTLNNNINIAREILFTTGKILTGDHTVVMNTTATGSIGNTNSYIAGKQQWDFTVPSTRFYSIGDATTYAGVNINYTNIATGGALNISTPLGDLNTIGTSNLEVSKSVNRSYRLTTPNAIAGTYNATFNFQSSNIDLGVDTNALLVGNFNGGSWSYPAVGSRTATSTQATGLTLLGDFQVAATKGDCTAIKIWNGTSWVGGTPTINDAVVINGTYDMATQPNISCCECTINAGQSLIVTANKTLTVSAGLTVSDNGTPMVSGDDGTLTIKDSGSLVQIRDVNNATANNNSGFIKMERTTKPLFRFDYTYWSSPVQDFVLKSVSPATLFDKFFSWKEDTQNWLLHNVTLTPNHQMEEGRGYIVRAPQTFNIEGEQGAVAATHTATFIGKPNNGTVTVPTFGSTSPAIADNKWNLLGNPYPSAIDATLFLNANSTLGGTLYFWTHNTSISTANPSYAPSDYASWNGTGGTATLAAASSGAPGSVNSSVPSGFIAAGQGFFVKGLTNGVGSATFNNSMRIAGENNQFFKVLIAEEQTTNTTPLQKHRVWLNLKGPVKGFNQLLVGYIENATNDFDNRFDGESFGGNLVTFYSINNTKNLVIQGRALPFINTDTVPLGYKTTLTGNLTISIDHVDGLMEDQDIYLQDNLLNVVHDLKASNYTFASVPGTFNTRFVLRYLPQENLSNPTFDDQLKAVRIYKNDSTLYVSSPYETIATVAVYDLTGRLVFERKNCNTNRFETDELLSVDQALIVKVTLSNGGVVTEKVAP